MSIEHRLWCTACKAVDIPLIKSSKNRYIKKSTGKEKTLQYYMCRDCNSTRARAYYNTPSGRKNIQKAIRKSESTPHGKIRRRAYSRVAWALRSGHLVKPCKCERCGISEDDTKRLEAHHHDYDKPLDVEWLCTGCHGSETFK